MIKKTLAHQKEFLLFGNFSGLRHYNISLKYEFLNVSTALTVRGSSVFCRSFSSIPVPDSLDASSICSPCHTPTLTLKTSPDIAKCLLGSQGEIHPGLRTTALSYNFIQILLCYFIFVTLCYDLIKFHVVFP